MVLCVPSYAYEQHNTSLHIVRTMEKYYHIQTGLEKISGLYGVVFSGIYDSIQIRYGVGLVSFCIESVCMVGVTSCYTHFGYFNSCAINLKKALFVTREITASAAVIFVSSLY